MNIVVLSGPAPFSFELTLARAPVNCRKMSSTGACRICNKRNGRHACKLCQNRTCDTLADLRAHFHEKHNAAFESEP